jgi:hypothetical protein
MFATVLEIPLLLMGNSTIVIKELVIDLVNKTIMFVSKSEMTAYINSTGTVVAQHIY